MDTRRFHWITLATAFAAALAAASSLALEAARPSHPALAGPAPWVVATPNT
jgi:hypothetical protein